MSKTETIQLTNFPTALGPMTLASSERGLLACSLPSENAARGERIVRQWLARRVPQAEVVEGLGRNRPYVAAAKDYLAGKLRRLDVPLDLRGTPFQKKVWSELRRVPYGSTISYAELARRAGHPRASRACGSANGSNPVPLFVPCHRTVASSGGLGGFGGGLPLKRKLLDLESRGAASSRGAARQRRGAVRS
ncbi:MAG: methylated-DNA--[protein]-cysteine S-methyltransferase [Planctomycetota bacterium]